MLVARCPSCRGLVVQKIIDTSFEVFSVSAHHTSFRMSSDGEITGDRERIFMCSMCEREYGWDSLRSLVEHTDKSFDELRIDARQSMVWGKKK